MHLAIPSPLRSLVLFYEEPQISLRSLRKEHHAAASIGLLQECGIDLDRHKSNGIPLALFAEYLTTSGLVLCEGVQWVCFHGIFDFAYLLKLLTGDKTLPDDEYQFQDALKMYFPSYVDVKTMAAPWSHLQGSLAKLCQELEVCVVCMHDLIIDP